MTSLTGPGGQFGAPACPPVDNRPRFRPHGPGASTDHVLREMAFVLHLTRSVRAAMTGREMRTSAKTD